jgi:hypothetical protein
LAAKHSAKHSLQLRIFAGISEAGKHNKLTTSKSVFGRAASAIGRKETVDAAGGSPLATSPSTSSPSRSPLGLSRSVSVSQRTTWKQSRVQDIAHAACWEIANSFSPVQLSRWLSRNSGSQSKLTGLFCTSVWLGPYIPHSADIGAFSNSTPSKVYKLTAQFMPKFVCVALFCDAARRAMLKAFLDVMVTAETELTVSDERMMSLVTEKDRGPFLFWLLNERCSCPSGPGKPVGGAVCTSHGLLCVPFVLCSSASKLIFRPHSVCCNGFRTGGASEFSIRAAQSDRSAGAGPTRGVLESRTGLKAYEHLKHSVVPPPPRYSRIHSPRFGRRRDAAFAR